MVIAALVVLVGAAVDLLVAALDPRILLLTLLVPNPLASSRFRRCHRIESAWRRSDAPMGSDLSTCLRKVIGFPHHQLLNQQGLDADRFLTQPEQVIGVGRPGLSLHPDGRGSDLQAPSTITARLAG